MKKFIITLLLLSFSLVWANEIEDFKFILALYKDANYKLAKTELNTFLKFYPNSNLKTDAKFLLANVYLKSHKYKKSQAIFENLYKNKGKATILPDVNFGLAQSLFFNNDYKKSKKLFNKFISKYSSHYLAWKAYYFLGKIQFLQNNYVKAAGFFENAYTLNSNSTILPAMLENLLLLQNFTRAEEVFNIALNHPKKDDFIYLTYVKYSQSLINQGKYQQLHDLNSNLVSKKSNFYNEYILNYAIALMYLQKNQQSLQFLQNLTSDKANYYKALCLINLNKNNEATKILNRLKVTSSNAEIKANAYFFEAKLEPNKQIAVKKLNTFIKNNPGNKLLVATYYQIALIQFNNNNYNKAINTLKIATGQKTTTLLNEQILFLSGECYFAMSNYKQAELFYKDCLLKHPNGKLSQDANFKTAICLFKQKKYAAASKIFTSFTIDETKPKHAESFYFLAEINLLTNKYDEALKLYTKAVNKLQNNAIAYLRIARIYYLQNNFDKALETLKNVDDAGKNSFEKHFLAGNIWFNSKNYKKAKKEYDLAKNYANNESEKNKSLVNYARSCYQLKQYKTASNIYKKVSGQKSTKGKYLLLAANSAFSAEDYILAIEYFTDFLNKYPNSKQSTTAKLGIADSYYNQGNYLKAANKYSKIIFPQTNNQAQQNALNGFKWSAMQNANVNFVNTINGILKNAENTNHKPTITLLLNSLISWHFDKQEYSECLIKIQHLLGIYPNYKQKNKVLLLKAQVLSHLSQFTQAERVFKNLYATNQSAKVLYAWHSLKLKQNNYDAAIAKLKAACSLSKNHEYWLKLLKLELKTNNPELSKDYNAFIAFADEINKQKAKIIITESYIKSKNYTQANSNIANLLKSSYNVIKAKAQFLKGYFYFSKGNYAKAIPELLRVRYLYPDVNDAKINAELMAFDAYIKTKDYENARKVIDGIKDEISADKLDYLEKTISMELK